MKFVEVAKVDDIPAGKMKHVEVSGKEILVANVDGKYYAVSDRCGHMNGRLSMGTLVKNVVTCPIHFSRFDVTTGRVVASPHLTSIEEYKKFNLPNEMLKAAVHMNDLQSVIKTYDLPTFKVQVEGGALRALRLAGADIVQCLDEVPALLAAAAAAGCAAEVRDASELRVKESDRIAGLACHLAAFGARVRECADGLDLEASPRLHPARVQSGGDHRLAMAAALLATRVPGESRVEDIACVSTSYPGFSSDLARLARLERS